MQTSTAMDTPNAITDLHCTYCPPCSNYMKIPPSDFKSQAAVRRGGANRRITANTSKRNCKIVTNSWESTRSLAGQGIPRILWNLKVYYRIYKSPLPILILSQIDQIPVPPYHWSQIHFNIILPSPPGFASGLLPSGIPTKPLYAPTFSPTCYTPRLSHSYWFYLPNYIWRGV